MQIRPTSVRLVRLNFGLRPKFRLRERLSEITSLFDLSLVLSLDRTLAQRKAQRKAKSKSEVAHCSLSSPCSSEVLLRITFENSLLLPTLSKFSLFVMWEVHDICCPAPCLKVVFLSVFLQGVSIACCAEPCVSYGRFVRPEPVEGPPHLPVGGRHVCSGASCYV